MSQSRLEGTGFDLKCLLTPFTSKATIGDPTNLKADAYVRFIITLAQTFRYSKFFLSKGNTVSYEASPLTSVTQGLLTMNSSYIWHNFL
jgi:hypothetical protein